MPTINMPSWHSLNRIPEIRNLSDAKYYVFILLLSEMEDDKKFRPNHLDLVQHDIDSIKAAKYNAVNTFRNYEDFNYFKDRAPYPFRYIARNVDMYLVQTGEDEYELKIPNHITINVKNDNNEGQESK